MEKAQQPEEATCISPEGKRGARESGKEEG